MALLDRMDPSRFAYCDFSRMNVEGEPIAGSERTIADSRLHLEGNLLPALAFGGFLQTHCVLLPRGLVEAAGGFDESFPHCEDFHLWLRLCALGATARFLDEPLARYRIRPGSSSSNAVEMRRWTVAALNDVARGFPAAIGAALPGCHDEFAWILEAVRGAGDGQVGVCESHVRALEAELSAFALETGRAPVLRCQAGPSKLREAMPAVLGAESSTASGGRGQASGSIRMRPLVSVVVTGVCGTPELCAAVESAIGQTYPRIEVVVADDGSVRGGAPDGTDHWESSGGGLAPGRNANVAEARNAGVAASAGELIVLLPSGVRLAPRMVEALAPRLDPSDPWSFAYSDYRMLDASGEPIPAEGYAVARVRSVLDGDLLPGLLPSLFFPPHCALIPRRLIDRLGGFDSRFAGRDDHHFWLRAACEGARASYLDAPLSDVQVPMAREDRDHGACQELTRRLLADVAARYPAAVAAAFGRMFLEASCETEAVWRDARNRLVQLEARASALEVAIAEKRQQLAARG